MTGTGFICSYGHYISSPSTLPFTYTLLYRSGTEIRHKVRLHEAYLSLEALLVSSLPRLGHEQRSVAEAVIAHESVAS